ncbi:MAG: hypothetical protein COA90_11045 [Gammaproteobacteria bacterium]|nr:MAG: hypothetical protein COA90_11045 [Gammaproteobacteria bacterium]
MSKQLKILIAEDNIPSQQLLKHSVVSLGHSAIVANNGQEAINLYLQHQPDLLLTDINMPIMDGLEAIKHIRSLQNDIWLPILVLSASSREEDIILGLEAGADDYLAKPINLAILHAKIKAMQRFILLQKDNQQKAFELEEEHLSAKQLADKMLSINDLNNERLQYWLCPNSHFGGDLITASLSPDNTLFVMLADSTGHGLAASLPTMSIAKTFHSLAKKGFSLPNTMREINLLAKQILPANRFVAINVFAINPNHKTIESWCGGLPESLAINKHGAIIHSFKSKHLAIGILNDTAFDATTDLWLWPEPIDLLAYSDGLTEAESPDGEFYGEERLLKLINKIPPEVLFTTIKETVLKHLDDDHGQDDISLLSIRCD